MRLPWVSRGRFEDSQAALANMDRLHELSLRRYDELIEKYHTVKLLGGAEPAPTPAVAPWAPDPVQIAISQKAGANQQLRTHYAKLAHKMRAGNLSDDVIVRTIEEGDDATASGLPA